MDMLTKANANGPNSVLAYANSLGDVPATHATDAAHSQAERLT